MKRWAALAAAAVVTLGGLAACNGLLGIQEGELVAQDAGVESSTQEAGPPRDGTTDSTPEGSTDAPHDSTSPPDADAGGGGGEGGEAGVIENPTTCAEAITARTYLGCDFWPTVTGNNVWSIFDFAVVVANPSQTTPAVVSVSGPGNYQQTITIAAGSLANFYLPWVPQLKGPDTDNCGVITPMTASVLAPGGAYHLVSDLPVAVYQFNALEYVGQGGPSGKSWASCPGNSVCSSTNTAVGCYSFTNDASMLLPSFAWTGNYRVAPPPPFAAAQMGAYFTVTAATDATHVNVKVSATGAVVASASGGTIPAVAAGGLLTLTLNQGDVAEILEPPTADLGGSLVQADQPVQVLAGAPCENVPATATACDHLEQTVPPAETLGADYVVTVPTGPLGNVVGHVVRFFGNEDGTTLTYNPAAPSGCPTTLSAGQVVDCGEVTSDFEVKGNHEFEVRTFMPGASLADPTQQPPQQQGDPSESFSVPVAQYRTDYLFVSPVDYASSFVDVVGPSGVTVTLNGAPLTQTFTPIGTSGYGIARVQLGTTTGGRHAIHATAPITIQVIGYGSYTSYQYPGGMNAALLVPPPSH
jgi:hypothetical protein